MKLPRTTPALTKPLVQAPADDGSRYRSLIASIALFLSLIGALLAFTFYTSNILAKNTTLINTTNHIANNAQSVLKDLFDLQNSYGEDFTSPHMSTVIKRLQDSSQSIEQSLGALEKGGVLTTGMGRTQKIDPITDPAIRPALAQTREQWEQLRPRVDDYLKVAKDLNVDAAPALNAANDQAKTSSLVMNDTLNTLTGTVYNRAQNEANLIRLIQLLGVGAILTYFGIFIFFFVRRLREADAQAAAAQRETAEIMANVNTGLFLLNKDLSIGNQYSAQLTNIMGTDQIAGENLAQLLKNKVTAKDLETTEGFVKQLYNPRVKEKLIDDLNPLKKVLLQDEGKTSASNKYLDFKFSRVYDQNNIARILVNVQDVTQQVRLEQRLEEERAQNDLQIEMLTTILNVSPAIINEFIQNTKQNIIKINNILKTPGSDQGALRDKLAQMYRIMHSLKGEASALNLHTFTSIANNFEEKLKGLQAKDKLSGNDFLPLTIHLDELLNLSNTIESLGLRINQNAAPVADTSAAPASSGTSEVYTIKPQITANTANGGMNAFYQQFADNIATRQQKQVQLKASGFNSIQPPADIAAVIKDITIQLIRNAVVHGIETPAVRESRGKPAVGKINLSLIELSESYKLMIEDDGNGLDFDAIRTRAVQMGYDADDLAQWSEQRLTSLLFKSGFSTREQADDDAGRGVGMDIIQTHIDQMNGQINVDSQAGKYTRMTVKIPKNPVQ